MAPVRIQVHQRSFYLNVLRCEPAVTGNYEDVFFYTGCEPDKTGVISRQYLGNHLQSKLLNHL
jgi:hypothetical protein